MSFQLLFYILLILNFLSSLYVIWDKQAARRGRRRIPERTLFLLAFLGGAPVMYFTMRLIHHKTLHRRFMWGLPLLIFFQVSGIFLLWHAGFFF